MQSCGISVVAERTANVSSLREEQVWHSQEEKCDKGVTRKEERARDEGAVGGGARWHAAS